MKRLLLVLSAAIILLFTSCQSVQKQHWIIVQVCQNDYLLNVNNNVVEANINYPIIGHCVLIPFSNKKIILSAIEYDPNYLEFIKFENNDLYFRPLRTGFTKFTVYTEKYGTASSLDIEIR